jgi:hypothetical protein
VADRPRPPVLRVNSRVPRAGQYGFEVLFARGFDAILEAIEATDGWVTNRVTPGKIILGELGDIESGVRQLIRNRPLEVTEVELPSRQCSGYRRQTRRCGSRVT